MSVSREEWERAEVDRSRIEANLGGPRDEASFLANHSNCGRYLDPPLDTPFALEYAYALLGDIRGKVVVDYGCGDGENCLVLASRGAVVKAIDISPDLIAIARRRMEVNHLEDKVEFIVGSAYEVPVPDGSVDAVFGMAILHHLDLAQASREVWRILKPGGKAIFSEPVRDLRIMRWARKLIPWQAPDVSPFERPLTERELAEFGARFATRKSRPFVLPSTSVIQLFDPLARRIGAASFRLDATLLRAVPFLRSFASTRVLELTK